MLTDLSVPYDLCIGITCLVYSVKAQVDAFNQEKAIAEAFSVIVKIRWIV